MAAHLHSVPLPGPPPRDAPPRPVRGGGLPPDDGSPVVPSEKIAVVILLVGVTMLFTGLIGAFLVLRYGAAEWPPTGQPPLPLRRTAANTLLLLASGVTMRLAVRAARAGAAARLRTVLGVTAGLGGLFLAVQGAEWARLLARGLTLSSSLYGATFYLLIVLHGLHVLGAVAWLLVVTAKAQRARYPSPQATRLAVELCAMYWTFVCALWLVLFWLVYLS